MNGLSMIGLDTAKSVFQLHGVDANGDRILVRRLKRRDLLAFFGKLEPVSVALEACSASHYWGREVAKLGHRVLLVPAAFVKRFVKGRRKTDARDAEALAIAGRAADLRPVPVKSEADQAGLALIKSRGLLVRQRTQLANAIRGHLTEFGVTAPHGEKGLEGLIARLEAGELCVPHEATCGLAALVFQWRALSEQIAKLTAKLHARAKADPACCLLMTMPGAGLIIASVFALKVDPARFRCGRDCAAWLGLTANENSSAKRRRLGSITKEGDEDLRSLLVLGAASLLMNAKRRPDAADPWVKDIGKRRPFKVAAVAVAARMARTLWAMLRTGQAWRAQPATAAPTAA